MEHAIWSTHFARQVAQRLGYGPPDAPPGAFGIDLGPEAERIVKDMTEAFRYLPPAKIQEALDLASFLRSHVIDGCRTPHRSSWMAEKLQEVYDFALFLKSRYGQTRTADESDYWTEEDRLDAQRAALQHLEEGDPYPWEDADNARAG